MFGVVGDAIRGLFDGVAKALKVIFGMGKPKETEIHEQGGVDAPKPDFDNRLERMQSLAGSESKGSDPDSSNDDKTPKNDGDGNNS